MTLVIMAAGMGSRFGGLKQLEPLDSAGRILADYSIYDAIRAGFDRVVIIIRKESEKLFKKTFANKSSKWKIKIDYAYQQLDDLPRGFICPKGRTKPWGTGQAVASLSGVVNEPFALINADDYYGPSAFYDIHAFLSEAKEDEAAIIGYKLKNTLTKSGAVSRGICSIDKGFLTGIKETTGIKAEGPRIVSDAGELDSEGLVSMNFWGLSPKIIEECRSGFADFLDKMTEKEHNVCEFYLPSLISQLVEKQNLAVRVIESREGWQGITYKEDKESLCRFLAKMTERGYYPPEL